MNVNESYSAIRLTDQPRPVPAMSLVNSIAWLPIMARGSKLESDMTLQIVRRCIPMLPASYPAGLRPYPPTFRGVGYTLVPKVTGISAPALSTPLQGLRGWGATRL